MKKLLDTNRLYPLFGWTLLGLLMILLALEGWRYGVKPSVVNNEQVIERSLNRASDYYLSQQKTLQSKSENLAATLRPALLQNQSSIYLNNTISQFPDFWGVALFKDRQPITWSGFAFQNIGDRQRESQTESSITIKKNNNVIYWECHVPFSIQDSSGTIAYDLFTSYRIQQSNPLAIGDRSEFNIFNSPSFSTGYPLNVSIFSEPPAQMVEFKTLTDLQGDSVGIVYATVDEFQQAKTEWERDTRFWRSVYALLCFIVLASIILLAADKLSLWSSLALQLGTIAIGWAIFAYTNTLSYWVLTLSEVNGNEWVTPVQSLSATFTNAIFGLFASTTIARKLGDYNQKIKPEWYLSTISLAGVFGLINALGILSFFEAIYQSTVASGVAVMDLRLFPDDGTIILYIVIGLATLAAGNILVALNKLLFRITEEHLKLTASVLSASFFVSLFVIQIFIPQQFIFDWIFNSSILSFAIILAISASFSGDFSIISAKSPLRKVVVGSLLIAIACTSVIYQTALHNTDKKLWKTAVSYSKEEDPLAAQMTEDLLIELERKFRGISKKDLKENRSTLQTRFTQTIQDFILSKSNSYSFDLQLVNPSGNLVADYSTDLNSPNWLDIFNISMLQMVAQIEQINKYNVRPVVQLPQLVNQHKYRTFYRGWIPIFGTSDQAPIAWILCSIYKERPQFNKPIRAVLASLTYEDWNTAYLMQKFSNGKLINTTQQGFAGYFPKHRTLGSNTLQALQNDTLIYLTENTADYSYRTMLWKKSGKSIIKASTTLPDYRVVLFSFFRFSFTLLLAGCLSILLWQMITWGNFQLFGKYNRFQDRILDSFLMATLIFLAFLVITSHYAIQQQNQDIVRQELIDKLERLSTSIEQNPAIRNNKNLGNAFSLDSLTTPLDVDASFYANRTVSETTTPQIYQQHLLPTALPYDIYDQLFNRQQQDAYSTVKLAGQTLLIGYRSIFNNQNRPVATIAIPTFLESPKYDQQLLETTSYLILAYLLVFGLFVVGSTVISKQLTRPLVYIQRGLNKISSGNLDTTIPVKSDDEIGNLAEAYNNMVYRLKKLQRELASAEREAAWKEMAQQVAHEIKNPLTPMKLNVQHLERQLKNDDQDPEELKKRVKKITNNLIEQIQSLNNIASDFSKFSQPLEKDFKKVHMSSILSSVAELYEHDEKVNVCFENKNSSLYTQGLADELKRVMINLVKNAYEAMPGGGEIVLKLYQQQQHIFIEVEDNGQGIPEEDRANIFVPNFSTKSSGTGLGLAICKKIVEAHEGSITFASIVGEGTTFVIKLPQFGS